MAKDGPAGVLSDGRKVRLDESKARTCHPDICNVRGTREEVSILFGKMFSGETSEHEAVAKALSRVVMNPSTAKRLIYLLGAQLLHRESQPDTPGGRLPTGTRGKPDLSRILSSDARKETAERAGLLLRPIGDLGIQCGFERSFKMSENTLLWNRFLIGVNKNDIGSDADARVLEICRETGMPKNLMKGFEEKLKEVNFVLFGFEENDKSCVHKAYLEYYDLYPEAIKKGQGGDDPFLLHMGYKWDAGYRKKTAVTEYTWHPMLSLASMHERISALYDQVDSNSSGETVGRILDMAAGRVNAKKFKFLEVTEENNPRSSLDINLYDAGLRLRELDEILEKACQDFSIPPDEFQKHYEGAGEGILGHLAGGVDRAGRDFLTVYYEPPES